MKELKDIVIHCSDSYWGCAREIRNWHIQKGWRTIGYHYVITNGWILNSYYLPCLDGMIENGRYLNEDSFIDDNEVGAHALGYNTTSIGICLIGSDKFTTLQNTSLIKLLHNLMDIHFIKKENVFGHCETPSGKAQGKTCPNFDVANIRAIL